MKDCKLCQMSSYTLTEKMAKILKARKILLICKICGCPILVGDKVESKQQRRGKTKLYHKKCYEDSHIDSSISDEEIDKELKKLDVPDEEDEETQIERLERKELKEEYRKEE